MPETGTEARRRLFDLFSRQITLYDPKTTDTFICPICFERVKRATLDANESAVSLAHVIPRSLGGKFRTLTCTPCNNECGTEMESYLVERLVAEDVMNGTMRKKNARLSGPFGEIGVEFGFSPADNTWSFVPVPQQSHPANHEAYVRHLHEMMSGAKGTHRITLAVRYDHRPNRVRAAFCQSAFLLLFAYFGYEVFRHPHLGPLWNRIGRPDEDGWQPDIIIAGDEAPAMLGKRDHALLFLREPSAILALLRLRPKSGNKRILAVLLPGLDSPTTPSNMKTFKGGIIPYRPQMLIETKGYLELMWHVTRKPTSQVDQAGDA